MKNSTVEILYDNRWEGPQGIARFAREVIARLPNGTPLPPGLGLFHPLDPIWLTYTIRRLAPKVYFAPGFNVPWRSSAPFVFVLYDLNYVHCAENTDFVRRAYFELLVKPACRRAARVLTTSEFSKSQIVEWSGVASDQVVNVSCGIGDEYRPDGPKYEPGFPYVLYVGNRLPHKNLPRMIEAFARRRRDCRFVITGRPDDNIISLARRFGVADALHFAGYVPDDKLPDLYRGARAVIMATLFEGFGLPVVEGMACGIPVLASTATSLPEIAGNSALLVDPTSVEAISGGIDRILSDDELRRDLAIRGLARARNFSWDKTARDVCEILQSVARHR